MSPAALPADPGADAPWPALDALLGAEGLPPGRVTEWVGAESSGKTGVLRHWVGRLRRQGVPVAWIDGAGALLASDFWDPEAQAPLWMLQPPTPEDALFCAELVLRTQSFGLVVLEDGGPLTQSQGVRLQRLARQAATALVRLRAPERAATPLAGLRLRFGAEPPVAAADPQLARVPLAWPVTATRIQGGPAASAALPLVSRLPERLTRHPLLPDRPSTRTRAGTRYGR